jgi:hypothetical protein
MQRICLWILIGATITCFWTLVMVVAGPHHNISHWTILAVTIPASVVLPRSQPFTYYEVMFVNAAIYGLIGLAVEPFLRLRHRSASEPALTR